MNKDLLKRANALLDKLLEHDLQYGQQTGAAQIVDDLIAALRSEPEPTPEPGERDERCEFELWMNTQPESASGKWWCRQIDDGGYSCHESDVMWRAWQAARASLPPAPDQQT